MGAPIGNQNAAKAKRWSEAVLRAIERYQDPSIKPAEPRSEVMKGIDAAAEAFVGRMMETKDLSFFKEFGDRIEGKAVQANEISGPGGGPVEVKAQPWNLQPVKPAKAAGKAEGDDKRSAGRKRPGR